MSAQRNIPFAICSYAYRLPGKLITDDDFWTLLENRERVRGDIRNRYGTGYLPVGKYHTNFPLASNYEGLITDGREWQVDPLLFGMSMLEATSMGPLQRMVLGCAWEAFERAGWSHQSLRNSATGVFLGCQIPSIATWRNQASGNLYDTLMTSIAITANRLSYHFNLKGPSITHATACSSGLTALYAAVRSIMFGDCRQALFGAGTYLGSGRISTGFSRLGVISPDGKSYSLDERANGYVRSEGVVLCTVKPLHLAEEDGDEILAVVESTAVNTAGAADQAYGLAPGRFISAPTHHSQVEVLQRAMTLANRTPREIDYVEMHATGTAVGDVIEGNAVAETYGNCTRDIPLRLSAVKSNLGHMEAAAFCGSLLKVLLMIERRTYAPISNTFTIPNPGIDFEKGPMVVQTVSEPFPDRQVVFGINSFGFGGSNGHCIVSEYVPETEMWSIPVAPRSGYMIPLSARSSDTLVQTVKDFKQYLSDSQIDIYTLAGNLSRRRTHHHVRTAFSALTIQELQSKLDTFLNEDTPPMTHAADGARRIAFVFAGQGTQWAGCGKDLYDTNPVFKRVVDTIEDIWCQYSNTSLREACFHASQENLDQVQLAQSVVFLIQVALVELLKTWGVYPDVVTGHSSGEVAAAYSCGLLSLEEAVRVVHCRAESQRSLAGSGRMLPIGLDRERVQQLLQDLNAENVEIVCMNSPASTVVAGNESALKPVLEACQEQKLQHTLLRGNIAFHSSAMDPIKDAILEGMAFLDECSFESHVPFISTVTGKEANRLDATYWWGNVRKPVNFLGAVNTIRKHHRPDIYIEISPAVALSSVVVQCYEVDSRSFPTTITTLARNHDGRHNFLNTLGSLFSAGFALNYAEQYPRPLPATRKFPGHPVNWINNVVPRFDDEMYNKSGGYSRGRLVGKRKGDNQDIFESILSLEAHPYMRDHQVDGTPILPSMGYVELLLEALGGDTPIRIEEIEFFTQCSITDDPCTLTTMLTPLNGREDAFNFKITTRSYEDEAEDQLNASGRILRFDPKNWEPDGPRNGTEIDQSEYPHSLFEPIESFYEITDAVLSGLYHYGPDFRTIKELRLDESGLNLYGEFEVDAELFEMGRDAGFIFLPQMLDAGVQTFLYRLMMVPDLFSIPRRAKNVTYIKPPATNRLIGHIFANRVITDYDHRGQCSYEAHEQLSGGCRFYDAETGDLLLEVGEYYSNLFHKDAALTEKTKYTTSWQPKFLNSVPWTALEPAALIDALSPGEGAPSVHRILEYVGSKAPESTLLHSNCLDALKGTQHEYILVGDTNDLISEHYNEVSHQKASIRGIKQDLTGSDDPDFVRGPFREHSISLILLNDKPHLYSDIVWTRLQHLLVPKGLVFVPCSENWTPPENWNIAAQDDQSLLLETIPVIDTVSNQKKTHWIFGESGSLARDWAAQHPNALIIDNLNSTQKYWDEAASVEAVDFFCSPEPDPKDPVGEKLAWKLLSFIQSFVTRRKNGGEPNVQITVVTQGAAFQVTNPRGYVLWGALRCIGLEHGSDDGIELQLVDVGDASDLNTLKWVSSKHLRERELAIRHKAVWVPRLIRIPEPQPLVPENEELSYSLRLKAAGQISGIEWQALPSPSSLGSNEVEIKVAAAPLNFRDIMVVLSLLPPMAYEHSALGRTVGIEGSGVVTRIGDHVTNVVVGDRVCYTCSNAITNYLVLPEWLIYKVPESCSLIDAASAFSVLQTAYYALVHQARMTSESIVLIHSAMGGVGQAAIQLVKMTGASFYASAGNEQKREKLRDMGALGAFDSHSIEWHRDLMEATGGKGVDIVLNSLAGQHLPLCLESLRPGGWHCEIGKVDIYANNRIEMAPLRKNLHFSAIDMDRLALDNPNLTQQIALECLELLGSGKIKAPEVTCFKYRDHKKALEFMMNGQHEGKIVLIPPEGKRNFPVTDMRTFFDAAGTYLVTGASGGLGTIILNYLVFCGAHHITVIDRDPTRKRGIADELNKMRESGMPLDFEVSIAHGDITNFEEVESIIANLDRPLKGVFHLAGALNDQLLISMTKDAVSDVFRPKALGAWNLHNATRHLTDLDHFVMFSSTASLLGNAGQSNYAAANAFMDALASLRQSQGLPALAFNLAGIRNQGMASRSPSILRSMDALGLPAISTTTAIANLDYALRTMPKSSHIASFMVENPVWPMDYPDYLRIGHLQSNQSAAHRTQGLELTINGVLELLTSKLSNLSGYDEINPESPFSDYGLTSVSVTELSAFIHATFRYRAGVLELMTSATPLQLAEAIVESFSRENRDSPDEAIEERASQTDMTDEVHMQDTIRKRSPFAVARADHFRIDKEPV